MKPFAEAEHYETGDIRTPVRATRANTANMDTGIR